ncbi:MAG: glycosyltransferase [Candidatus Bathyarchaeia archaeon]
MSERNSLRISVVIPTLQESEYIGDMLSDLVKSSKDLEIIVVDGGSTDGTVDIAKRFTDKVYILDKRGIGRARNYGASKANGDILIFMDADIKFPIDFAEKIILAFRDKNVIGVICNIMPLDPSPFEEAFFRFYNFLLHLFTYFKPHSQGKFFAVRREAFLKVGGFNENLPCIEDHDLALRLSKIGRIVFLSDLTVYESMRRFKRMGFLRVLKMWISNYISYLLFNRTISKSWEPIR